MIRLKKGLDLPIAGQPEQTVSQAPEPSSVALLGPDYNGMKPSMAVQPGDRVATGQLLFEDKRNPGVRYTAPGSGTVEEINRGARRAFQSLVIRLDGDEHQNFASYSGAKLEGLSEQQIRDLLLESGLWTALRTRPFSKAPAPVGSAQAIFVTAMDTNPLAPCPEHFLSRHGDRFLTGLAVLAALCPGKIYLCKAPGQNIPLPSDASARVEEFSGPHPAGLPGTHIHFLEPVHAAKTVWHLGYQDVAAIGHLFETGELLTERIISLAGPQVRQPRLLATRLGASITDLTSGELHDADNRIITGSVLNGHTTDGPFAYLGRFHNQISVIEEGHKRLLLGWLMPGPERYSIKPVFLSRLLGKKFFNFTSTMNGEQRAIIPIGSFEKVMPLDLEPVYLLRALAICDTDQAQALGCLELDEEDLALLTFTDQSKNNFGSMLRETLTLIEKEG